ncbi:hypothetical protein PAHAL_1G049800 [Panicum hallii]|uniref:Uncharacterized protein n=1 Tax=Panicum hallii TaxID=206008 RepID=A0A2T8KU36_9POAL|nr:hypothetical protein PAHAL_1G049800 [Panicum hallii]
MENFFNACRNFDCLLCTEILATFFFSAQRYKKIVCDLQAPGFTYPPSSSPFTVLDKRIAESEPNSSSAGRVIPPPIPTAGPVSSATETRIHKRIPSRSRDATTSSRAPRPPPQRLRSPLAAGLSPAAAGAPRVSGHRTRLHPLDRAPPPPAAGLTPRLSPLGPGELAVERRGCRRRQDARRQGSPALPPRRAPLRIHPC